MGAEIDLAGTYRYSLWREWNLDAPRISFVMLNPSTADATANDPTIRRCISFAQSWGYGSLEVVNLFAYRATNPNTLLRAADPIGPENDRHLLAASQRAQTVILAWGNWGTLHSRNRAIISLLSVQKNIYCLGRTQAGHPRHPLYVKGNMTPVPCEQSVLKS